MTPRITAPIRLGFVGCGRATCQLHLPALGRVSGIEVVGLADIDRRRLDAAADLCGVRKRFIDYPELLSDPKIDAVAVCVPPQHHTEVALAVLDAGKHLFIEKPLALSLKDCDRLVERASRAMVRAQIGFNLRQHRLVRELQRSMERGDFGRIEMLRSVFTAPTRLLGEVPAWRDEVSRGGDVLIEVASHHFDLWRFLSGSEVEEVFVSRAADVAGSAAMTARMRDGTPVSAAFSEGTAGCNELEVFSSRSRVRLDLYRFDGVERASAFEHTGDVRVRLRRLRGFLATFPRGLAVSRRGGDYRMSYEQEWRRFAGAILEGEPLAASLEDGRAAVAIALAAVESADTGMPVAPAEAPAGPPRAGVCFSPGARGSHGQRGLP